MPYVIRPPVRRRSLFGALLAAAVCTVLAASPSQASLLGAGDCPATALTNPFAPFGDFADYTLVPGGDFESRDPGWSLRGAGVVRGDASPDVGSRDDSRSLRIDGNGEAVSPAFCISDQHPTFRFNVRQRGDRNGQLRVGLRWTNGLGQVREAMVEDLDADNYDAWHPSPILPLWSRLDLLTGTQDVQLVFRVIRGAEWQIDDVYYDPYRR
jgi:hypothetical protein